MPYRFHKTTAVAETEKGLRVLIYDEGFWVPKSQVHDDSEVYKEGDEGTLILKNWWCEEREPGLAKLADEEY